MGSSMRSIFITALCIVLNIVRQCDCGDTSSADNGDEDKTLQEALLLIKIIKTGTTPNSPAVAELFGTFQHTSMPPPLLPRSPQDVLYFNHALNPQVDVHRLKLLKNLRPYRRAESDMSGLLAENASADHFNNALYRRSNFENSVMPQQFSSNTESPSKTEALTAMATDLTAGSITKSKTDAEARTVTTNGTVARETVTRRETTATTGVIAKIENRVTSNITNKTATYVTITNNASRNSAKMSKSAKSFGNSRNRRITKLFRSKLNQPTSKKKTREFRKKKYQKAKKYTRKFKSPSKSENGTYPGPTDPILRQIKSELEKEIEGMSSVRNISRLTQFDYGKHMDKKEKQMPSSLRVHLKMSSKYPVPLPENHAFCYHHPNNGLCRTP